MFQRIKEEIKQIIEIVEIVPERYRDKCFDLLFSHLLTSAAPSDQTEKTFQAPSPSLPPLKSGDAFTIPAKVRTFIKRYSIDEKELRNLVMVENNEVHFIYEPADVKNAAGQIQWALLLALKSALLGGEMIVDPEAVRSICIEKGFYDKANFTANFKKPNTKGLFNGPIASQGTSRKLSSKGEEKLAEVMKTLVKAIQ